MNPKRGKDRLIWIKTVSINEQVTMFNRIGGTIVTIS
jgi:hypothetical protein